MVHTLRVEAGTVPSEGGTQAAEIKVVAYHVHELHSSSMLGEAILALALRDAHQSEVGECEDKYPGSRSSCNRRSF